MKTTLKKIWIAFPLFILALGMVSCENEDYLVFTAQEPSDAVAFTNSFSSEYVLSTDAMSNTIERFVWNVPDFDAPTTINYEVQGSITPDFSTIDYTSGTLSETNHAITVRNLTTLAELMELDRDPSTTDDNGEPNNTGTVYFRIRAYVGTDDAVNGVESISETAEINITLVEEAAQGSGIEISSWGIVGSAANDWGGAGPDLPFYTTEVDGVLVAYVNLIVGEIKFRENNDWGNNYGDTGADGTLEAGGDNMMIATAGDYKITFDLNNLTYAIEAFSWGIVGSAYNDWGATPDAKLFYDYTTNTFKRGVKLMDGEMKFRFNNDWAADYGDSGADGTLESGGTNITVTAGFYMVTFDLENLMYTIEEADLYGIVGSGYNNWGETPDFMFTQVSEGIWYAENVTLVDGEIKFRVNEDWGVNYGDTGADGVLDNGSDNIAVTAGTYDITLDFTDPSAPTYTMVQ